MWVRDFYYGFVIDGDGRAAPMEPPLAKPRGSHSLASVVSIISKYSYVQHPFPIFRQSKRWLYFFCAIYKMLKQLYHSAYQTTSNKMNIINNFNYIMNNKNTMKINFILKSKMYTACFLCIKDT